MCPFFFSFERHESLRAKQRGYPTAIYYYVLPCVQICQQSHTFNDLFCDSKPKIQDTGKKKNLAEFERSIIKSYVKLGQYVFEKGFLISNVLTNVPIFAMNPNVLFEQTFFPMRKLN